MKTREDILDLLLKNKANLQTRYQVTKIALFGSFARGDHSSNSDVDILIEVPASIGLRFVTLAQELQNILQMKVDLVSTRALKKNIRDIIQNEALYV